MLGCVMCTIVQRVGICVPLSWLPACVCHSAGHTMTGQLYPSSIHFPPGWPNEGGLTMSPHGGSQVISFDEVST